MIRIAILIDGGHLRVLARSAGHTYDPDFIEKVAHACVGHDETILRILYYDCAPYSGQTKLPVSGKPHEFKGSDAWLKQLAAKDLFALFGAAFSSFAGSSRRPFPSRPPA